MYIFYEIDEQEAEHAESLTRTRKKQTMMITSIQGVLLEKVEEWVKKLSLGSKFVTNLINLNFIDSW